MGVQQIADLTTSESRWRVGAVLRYPLGTARTRSSSAAALSYGKQKFTVAQKLPNNEPTDIPNVRYTMISPARVRAGAGDRRRSSLNADARVPCRHGHRRDPDSRTQYGAATVTGFELELGADYMITKNIFVRAGDPLRDDRLQVQGRPDVDDAHARHRSGAGRDGRARTRTSAARRPSATSTKSGLLALRGGDRRNHRHCVADKDAYHESSRARAEGEPCAQAEHEVRDQRDVEDDDAVDDRAGRAGELPRPACCPRRSHRGRPRSGSATGCCRRRSP